MQRQRAASTEKFVEWDALSVWREFLQQTGSDYTRALPYEKLAQLPLFLAELHRGIARKKLRLFPQVRETLDQLRGRYPTAVVSDAQSAYAVPELRAVGILDYFHPVIVSGDYGYRKPDPRLFQHALSVLDIRPEQALYVGNDLYHDILGAQQVGMKAILVSYDRRNIASETIKPDYIIYNFAELLEAVKYFGF